MNTWRANQNLHNVPLPEPFLAALVGGYVLQRAVPWQLPGTGLQRGLSAGPLLVSGAAVVAVSVRAANAVDLAEPEHLVTRGPYRVVRNPMYDAWALLALGCGLALGSFWPLALLPVAAAVVHREVTLEEERLASRFGSQYSDYRTAVPRYLPQMRLLWARVRG